eukprot:754129-Rhodomonas_salina.1
MSRLRCAVRPRVNSASCGAARKGEQEQEQEQEGEGEKKAAPKGMFARVRDAASCGAAQTGAEEGEEGGEGEEGKKAKEGMMGRIRSAASCGTARKGAAEGEAGTEAEGSTGYRNPYLALASQQVLSTVLCSACSTVLRTFCTERERERAEGVVGRMRAAASCTGAKQDVEGEEEGGKAVSYTHLRAHETEADL